MNCMNNSAIQFQGLKKWLKNHSSAASVFSSATAASWSSWLSSEALHKFQPKMVTDNQDCLLIGNATNFLRFYAPNLTERATEKSAS